MKKNVPLSITEEDFVLFDFDRALLRIRLFLTQIKAQAFLVFVEITNSSNSFGKDREQNQHR